MNAKRLVTVLFTNIKLCFLEILTNKARTFITSLGIFLGVTSLLVNLAFVRAMDENIRKNMERIGGLNLLTLKTVEPVTVEEKVFFQRSPGLTIKDGEVLVCENENITGIIKEKDLRWQYITLEGNHGGGHLKAVDTNYINIYNYRIGKGRSFTRFDFEGRKPVCIIGPRLVERLWEKSGDPIGKNLTVKSLTFEIVGILDSEGMRSRRDMECLIPYSVYEKKIGGKGGKVDELALILSKIDNITQIEEYIEDRIQTLHRGVKDVETETNADKIKEMKSASAGIQILLWAIAGISLLVGGISIMNIMFATIGDRIREIGIRKALGAKKLDIFIQFIIEAILVCSVGGSPGIITGTLITLVPPGTFPFNPQLTISDYSLAFGFTVLSGFISGFVPALKAAQMQPIEALRY